MLTPQEISNREFTKAVFGGYDMGSVDEFIESITADYAALYKENAILKSKLKVLVDKVEEYRSTEDSMRMALLTAQTMGDEIISEANSKRDKMLAEAEDIAKNRVAAVKAELTAEQERLRKAKEDTAMYAASIRALMAQQEKYLEALTKANTTEKTTQPVEVSNEETPAVTEQPAPVQPIVEQPKLHAETPVVAEAEVEPMSAQDAKEEQIMDTAMEIDSAVSKLIESTPDYKAEPSDAEQTKVFKKRPHYDDEDEPTSPRPKFNFDDLQFGANYDTGRIR